MGTQTGLYDCNASIGAWPFRAHRTRSAAELLARMDELGIGRALVGSLSAVMYRDSMAGTEEMLEEIAPHRERLTPTAVLNPRYAGWERDLAECHERHGCVGVRLYPTYHGYDLAGSEGQRIIAAIAERRMLTVFVCRHEDRRQRHAWDQGDEISLAGIAAAMLPHPEARFLVLEGFGFEQSPFLSDPVWREREFGVEISRLATLLTKNIPAVVKGLGAERVLFGTGLPLKGPHSALLKLRLLEVDEATRAAIGGGNLARLTDGE